MSISLDGHLVSFSRKSKTFLVPCCTFLQALPTWRMETWQINILVLESSQIKKQQMCRTSTLHCKPEKKFGKTRRSFPSECAMTNEAMRVNALAGVQKSRNLRPLELERNINQVENIHILKAKNHTCEKDCGPSKPQGSQRRVEYIQSCLHSVNQQTEYQRWYQENFQDVADKSRIAVKNWHILHMYSREPYYLQTTRRPHFLRLYIVQYIHRIFHKLSRGHILKAD